MTKEIKISFGEDNVFASLRVPNSDDLRIKAKIADQISDITFFLDRGCSSTECRSTRSLCSVL